MTLSALFLYAAVYFAAVATPGPGVAALVARVVAQGLAGIAPFLLGFVVGDLIWLAIAAAGLALVAKNFAAVFYLVRLLGAAYLLYIAWGLVRARPGVEAGAATPPGRSGLRAFLGALSLTLGNPKVIVFFLSIMPLAVDLPSLTLLRFGGLCAVTALVLAATLGAYAFAAHRARAFLRSTRAMGLARKAAAGVMAGVAVAIVTR
jgi:threonine/homoserine/homoserine lactone efflux protein